MVISLRLPRSKVALFAIEEAQKIYADIKTNLLSLHFLNSRVECAMIKDYHWWVMFFLFRDFNHYGNSELAI